MEPKHGTVRLDAAAEWLSKTTGRTFTADDLIDAHDRLPVYAVIPESKCNPEHSEPVLREFREKAIEVERLTKSHPRSLGGLAAADAGVPRGLFTPEAIAEVAVRRMRPDIALLHKWEQAAKKQSVYLLSDEDVSILAANGEVRLGRAVSIFNRWIGRPIQFGNPVDVTPDMLAVRRSQLVKFAEIVAAEQPEARPAAQEQAAPAKPKRETQAGRIALYVSECERRAAELGETFDRARMPGTKADFLDLLHALDAGLRTIKSVGSLDRYLNGYQWEGGRQPSAAPLYARLFPEARIRVPGAVSQQRGKS
ncbi:hypothetical protein ACUH78_05535 [Thauera sp. ZXT1-4]|uniref:hypothetical protein n=1 Tax=Thauera sp. ZXT1-4 TaxID=3460294 RepID=UPI0040408D4E